MPVNVYPVASASSVTPISGSFDYNFSTTTSNSSITIDFTDSVPASTYTISGVTEGGFPVAKVQLLTSSDSVVAEGVTTYVSGTYNTANAGTYTISLSAPVSFTKIKLIGINGQQAVKFGSTAPTGAFHVALRPGTRSIVAHSIFQKIIDAGEGANYSIAGVTLPTGYPYAYWIYNSKLYVWYGTVEAGTSVSSSTVNTQGIRAYNFETSSWESNLVSFNSSVLGANTYATPASTVITTNYISTYVFKNGNVLIRTGRMYNTDGSTSTSYGTYSFFFNLTAGTVTNKSTSFSNIAALLNGPSAYIPSTDTWYAMGYVSNGTYADALYKITNAGAISSVSTTTNGVSSSYAYIWAEDSATPKLAYITNSQTEGGAQWRSIQSNGTLDTQVTNSTAISNSNLIPIGNINARNVFVGADLFGQTDTSFRMNQGSSNPVVIYQDYTYPSSTTLSGTGDFALFSQVTAPQKAFETYASGTIFYDANSSSLVGYFQPISSTDYAVVFRGNNGLLNTRANIVVCPISSTTQTVI